MSFEYEVKHRILRVEQVEKGLSDLGAAFKGKKIQKDVYFSHPERDFGKSDEALRIRTERGKKGDACYLTYKGPKLDPEKGGKSRREIEVRTAENEEVARALLEALGFVPAGTVEKTRRYYLLEREYDIEICLDSIKGLGQFLELEIRGGGKERDEMVKAVEELRTVVKDLGPCIGPELVVSYLELLSSPGQ